MNFLPKSASSEKMGKIEIVYSFVHLLMEVSDLGFSRKLMSNNGTYELLDFPEFKCTHTLMKTMS